MDTADFKEALSRFPSGVVVATTVDKDGCWRGFTASAFCSLSLEPPMILLCIARNAECHGAFTNTPTYAVSLLGESHQDLAVRFATKGVDKFADHTFVAGPTGVPILQDALASLICQPRNRVPGGDHTVLIGEVLESRVGDGAPMLFYRRDFYGIGRAATSTP